MSSSLLLLCILVTCSVWTVQGKSFKVSIDDEEASLKEGFGAAQRFPGVCWACTWALKKVKNVIGPNVTAEQVKAKLKAVCDQIGLLKSKCHKFVDSHLGLLVEELTTSDDINTICVNTGACRSEAFELLFSPNKERHVEINELP
ncbi:NK-lysin tandem duplicate 4 [Nematolebias whitei]|uniref:NK-lysin tandem duplicate 4 n=1 Tax=Nematolebias whitei TaxID=451745 RepID=UPI00189A36F1|nr:NK-lysin tandem duplicate 4 [Nematolebias whitei]